jgi:SAP domain-containing ribonucleoprotein
MAATAAIGPTTLLAQQQLVTLSHIPPGLNMDAKLKALKVVDLKSILATASVSVPAKATKSDLIARIQASKPALAAYATLYPTDDLLTPPEESVLTHFSIFFISVLIHPRIDWNADQSPPATKPTTSIPIPSPPAPATTIPAPAVSPPVITSTPTIDPELEKRRQRAARFGIPLVEAPVKTTKSKPTLSKPTNAPVVRQSRYHSVLSPLYSSLGLKEA